MASEIPSSTGSSEIVLARWSDRFFAWLVDFIIISVPLWIIFFSMKPFDYNPDNWMRADGSLNYGITSVVFFVYWTILEVKDGQSIGKRLLHIRTTDLAGGNPGIGNIALQSFGKAFLLPIDLILGWIFTNEKRQRLLNRASKTIVIKVKQVSSPDMRYTKD